jgi:hypothetical protein
VPNPNNAAETLKARVKSQSDCKEFLQVKFVSERARPPIGPIIKLDKPGKLNNLDVPEKLPAHRVQIDLWGAAVIVAVVGGLVAWLWPIGLGDRMPVGGDVTQFFIGLMGVFARSLERGALPVWNDLWGYGFPGIGESQMGVYYPPHLLLYGTLQVERAYVLSLVLHTIWAGVGAWWAARTFGVSVIGSGLAAFAFAASGFFVIHMPHPWGYTTGSWMPWAWGLAWSILVADAWDRIRRVFLLSLVLFLQLLPGHFQLAFLTQAGLGVMALWFVIDPAAALVRDGDPVHSVPRAARLRRVLPLAGGLAVVFPLAALQLWPTARLARLAAAQRNFDFLSLFSATPLHLVNFVAPGLFHRSPLWRPLVWTPFHTSPEELLPYLGLVPLFLALLAMRHGLRRDPVVRLLTLIALVSLFLSLGPFVPGFRLLIELPGFSFFRAPARWTLATTLALAILAGKGLERARHQPESGRWLMGLAAGAIVWIIAVVLLVELAILCGSTFGHPWLTSLFQQAFRGLPWSDERDFLAVLAKARSVDLATGPYGFVESRGGIYTQELTATAGLLVAIALVGWIASLRWFRTRHRYLTAGLIVLSVVDLLMLGQYKLVSNAPLRPLAVQSPVIARLAQEPRGTRIVDGFGNLSMLVGLEPISAYRTLDLPALEPLTHLAQAALAEAPFAPLVQRAMRACGVGMRVVDPAWSVTDRSGRRPASNKEHEETIDDPALAGWLLGPSWTKGRPAWASKFRIIRPESAPSRAWFLPLTALKRPAMLDAWSGDLEVLLELFDEARPLPSTWLSAQRLDVDVDAEGPGWVIVSQLADPQWHARWSVQTGAETDAELLPTFRRKNTEGGWQRVKVAGAGRRTLHLEYVAQDVNLGLAISGLSWVGWCLVVGIAAVRARKRAKP